MTTFRRSRTLEETISPDQDRIKDVVENSAFCTPRHFELFLDGLTKKKGIMSAIALSANTTPSTMSQIKKGRHCPSLLLAESIAYAWDSFQPGRGCEYLSDVFGVRVGRRHLPHRQASVCLSYQGAIALIEQAGHNELAIVDIIGYDQDWEIQHRPYLNHRLRTGVLVYCAIASLDRAIGNAFLSNVLGRPVG